MSGQNSPTAESTSAENKSRRTFLKTAGVLAAGLVVGGAIGGTGMYYLAPGTKAPAVGIKQGTGTLTIGASVTTSGPAAAAISEAVTLLNSMETLINARGGVYASDMGGYIPVKIIVLTDDGSSTTIKSNYDTLVTQDNVDILLGPFTAAPSETASAVAIQYGVPYVDTVANEAPIYAQPDPGHWVVGCNNLINFWTWGYFNVLHDQTDAKTIALIDLGDDFSTGVTGTGTPAFGATNFAKLFGFDVVATDHVNTTFSPNFDYTAEVQRMISLDPDVIIFADPIGVFQAGFWLACKSGNYKPRAFHATMAPIGAFQGIVGSTLGNNISGELVWSQSLPYEGVWGKSTWNALNIDTTKWNFLPIDYASLEIASSAVTLAGSTKKTDVANAMNSMEIMTLLGPWKAQNPLSSPFAPPNPSLFGQGMGLPSQFPIQMVNDQPVILWPYDIAQAKYVYPEPISF